MSRYDNILQSTATDQTCPLIQYEGIAYEADPRPELKADHDYWVLILTNARADEELYHMLKYLRSQGAGLQRTKTSFKLVPGLWLHSDWERVRIEILTPLKDKLVELFSWSTISVLVSVGETWEELGEQTPRQEVLFDDEQYSDGKIHRQQYP